MMTYQVSKDAEPQPIDKDGRLLDGTPVIVFENKGRMVFKEGIFTGIFGNRFEDITGSTDDYSMHAIILE